MIIYATMKPQGNEVAAALWATCTFAFGGITLSNHNDAVRAENTANIYEQQGDYAQAAQWEAIADDERGDRTVYLSLAVVSLSLVSMNSAVAVAARNKRREEQQAEGLDDSKL